MVEHLALSESGFLFDARTGSTFSLNRTGTYILRALIDGVDPNAVSLRMIDTFDIDPPTAERDVETFLFRLRELGLVATDEDEDGPEPQE